MISGIRSPTRSLSFQQSSVVEPHVITATKLLSTNLQANLCYTNDSNDGNDHAMDEDNADKEASLLAKDAAKCMYLGNQLNLLYVSLCEERRDRRILNVPLLLNILLSFGRPKRTNDAEISFDDVYSAANSAGQCWSEESDTPSSLEDDGLVSAIRFVLMHSLRDMAQFAAKEKQSSETLEPSDKSEEDKSTSPPQNAQRMSRAVASSLPSALSLLQRLISRQLVMESQMTLALTKMKSADFFSLTSSLPRRETNSDSAESSSTVKFNAAQFTRALHLKLAKLSNEALSDQQFPSTPAHVVHPYLTYIGEVIRSLEEASKVVPPPVPSGSSSVTERISLSDGGSLRGSLRELAGLQGLQDPNSRSGRILASMGLMREPGIPDGQGERQRPTEPFEPSEESISRLAEMGFSRDHALESLERSGSNSVEAGMEYALSHPPSSPATLERRRAAREQRRQAWQRNEEEFQQRSEELRQQRESAAPANDEDVPGRGDNTESTATETQDKPPPESTSKTKDEKEDEPKPKPLTDEEMRAKREKETEERLAAEAKEYLQTMKDSLCKICLDIIEVSVPAKDAKTIHEDREKSCDRTATEVGDWQEVIVVVSNFLLGIARGYPELESSIATSLLQRLKACLDVKSPSHCRVKSSCDEKFAALAHCSVIILRSLPKSRPSVLRHGLVGMITHCVRNCTLASSIGGAKSPMAWPRWLVPALLVLEVMAQPTTISLESEDKGQPKPTNKKSEYGKVFAVCSRYSLIISDIARTYLTFAVDLVYFRSTRSKQHLLLRPLKSGF